MSFSPFYDKAVIERPINVADFLAVYLRRHTYILTPGSRALLEKITGFQLVKKLPAFCGTSRYSAVDMNGYWEDITVLLPKI
jgi:hypothetical protein